MSSSAVDPAVVQRIERACARAATGDELHGKASPLAASVVAAWAVLASPSQRRIQFGWGGCIAAEGAQLVALGLYSFDAGGVVAVGLLGVMRTLPPAVVGPFAAAAVDRRARSRVLSSVLLTRAAALAASAVLVAVDAPVACVLALASADAVAFSLYWPVHSALQPEIAGTPYDLTAANATTTTVENVATLVGPAFAGALLAVAPVSSVLVAVAVLLLAGAAAVQGVPATKAAKTCRDRRYGGCPRGSSFSRASRRRAWSRPSISLRPSASARFPCWSW